MASSVPASDATVVIGTLRASHERLRALVGSLGAAQLRQQSYAKDWTVAAVLSHLGSGAEIQSLMLDSALRGEAIPSRDRFAAIWDVWNARGPETQASEALLADQTSVQRLEELDDADRRRFRLDFFGRELDLTGFVRMRLGEHAIHSWDIAVVLDGTATLPTSAVDQLIDTLAPLAARSGKPTQSSRRMRILTAGPERHFILDTGAPVALTAADDSERLPMIRMPAEACIRLVYGRLDPGHTPPLQADGVDLDELRAVFPGF